MESSNQFHDSFRQGLTAGYVFTATFVIVLYMSYFLPAQLIKNRKSRTGGYKKATQKRKSPHQELRQEKIKEVAFPFAFLFPHILFIQLDLVIIQKCEFALSVLK
ncbi:inactive leucine-rich repeat receptor protein kinase isoform X1 [Spatholobus suberectus]|nr:inactive leucine-rich repeat receptor protein kinase isoform X1 [Spatholobus suberectus]